MIISKSIFKFFILFQVNIILMNFHFVSDFLLDSSHYSQTLLVLKRVCRHLDAHWKSFAAGAVALDEPCPGVIVRIFERLFVALDIGDWHDSRWIAGDVPDEGVFTHCSLVTNVCALWSCMWPLWTDESCDSRFLPFCCKIITPLISCFQHDFKSTKRNTPQVLKHGAKSSLSCCLEHEINYCPFQQASLQNRHICLKWFHQSFALLSEIFNHEGCVSVCDHTHEVVSCRSPVFGFN